MVAETLPCAEKSCSSQMSLIEEKDDVLYYRCLEKHIEHYFRYNVAQKQWERLIFTRKLVLHFDQDPYFEDRVAESLREESATDDFGIEQSPVDDFEIEELPVEAPEVQKSVADDLEIEKSVVDEFEQSLVAPVKTPIKVLPEEPVDESPKESPVTELPTESADVDSDLRKIKGIGSPQLKDLKEAGVLTVSDLANSSASDLSRKTGYAISQLINWIVKAKTLAEEVVVSA
ncbi:MAG: hypothetical protein ACOWW1_02085 [archaeon]